MAPPVKIRGIRQQIPPGHILGRATGSGSGDAQLIHIRELASTMAAALPFQPPTTLTNRPADFAIFFSGKPAANQRLAEFPLTRAITIPASLAGSSFGAADAPTAAYTITVSKNGTAAGTIVLNPTGSPTITFASSLSLVVGDILLFQGQATTDSSLADIYLAIQATFQ